MPSSLDIPPVEGGQRVSGMVWSKGITYSIKEVDEKNLTQTNTL
jgi:hypothetical protein